MLVLTLVELRLTFNRMVDAPFQPNYSYAKPTSLIRNYNKICFN